MAWSTFFSSARASLAMRFSNCRMVGSWDMVSDLDEKQDGMMLVRERLYRPGVN